jgi:hypothetical protein
MYLKYCDLFLFKYLQLELQHELQQSHHVREFRKEILLYNLWTIQQSHFDKFHYLGLGVNIPGGPKVL